MEGRGRTLILLLAIGGAAYWFYSHREKPAAPASPSTDAAPAGGAPALGCLQAAESANRSLHDAGMLLLRPPVDAAAWSAAESSTVSAISTAEASCSGGTSASDRRAAEEARAALSLMRASLSDYSNAARGASGAAEASNRQASIEEHLDRARGTR